MLSFFPVDEQSSIVPVIITVTVTDAGFDGVFDSPVGNVDDAQTSLTFSVTVTPVNDAPEFDPIEFCDATTTPESCQLITDPWPTDEDTDVELVLSATDIDNEFSELLFEARVSEQVPPLEPLVNGPHSVQARFEDGRWKLVVGPSKDFFGTIPITVTVSDSGQGNSAFVVQSASLNFEIQVNPVNDAPVLERFESCDFTTTPPTCDLLPNNAVTTNEDTPFSVRMIASDVDNEPGDLRFEASEIGIAGQMISELSFAGSDLSFVGSDLSVDLVGDQFGQTQITVTVFDSAQPASFWRSQYVHMRVCAAR